MATAAARTLRVAHSGAPGVSIFLAMFLLGVAPQAHACPDIAGIPDYNCDGSLKITIMGDSIAYGFGDTQNKNRGGYALRLAKKIPAAQVTNLGKPGMRSFELMAHLKDIFKTKKFESRRTALLESDIVILDIGRNDRWLFGEPITTYKNLLVSAKRIRDEVKKVEGTSPLVVIAAMMLPNRGSQGPWVKALNSLIVAGSTTANPANLRFDLVSKRLLSYDQIHPTSAGYEALTRTLVAYLRSTLTKYMRVLRPDTDADGIPDIIETTRTGTDPSLYDTDGDGLSDGFEVYVNNTNPRVAEVVPTPTPTPTPVPTATETPTPTESATPTSSPDPTGTPES